MSDSPAAMEGKPERKINWHLNPLSLLGWVLGGLSLLNLIEELSPLKVLGKLKTWLDAYTSIVNDVGTFLFGWIDFGWIAIDQLEVHVLVIATILVSAYVRADIRAERSKGFGRDEAIVKVSFLATIFNVDGFFAGAVVAIMVRIAWCSCSLRYSAGSELPQGTGRSHRGGIGIRRFVVWPRRRGRLRYSAGSELPQGTGRSHRCLLDSGGVELHRVSVVT